MLAERSFLRGRLFVSSTAASFLIVGLTASSALGLIHTISGNVGESDIYDGTTQEWALTGNDGLGADLTAGEVEHFGGSPAGWYIEPTWDDPAGDFLWTGTFLQPPDASFGGFAQGNFKAGGTLSLRGSLYLGNDESTAILIHEGLLFQGTVAGFTAMESFFNPNRIDLLGIKITPTGGWLKEENHLIGNYDLYMMSVEFRQNGGDLTDFTNGNIRTFGASEFLLVSDVPEPLSAGVFCCGMVLAMWQRRRRGV